MVPFQTHRISQRVGKMLNEYTTYLQEKGASLNTIISNTNDLNIFFNDLHIR